MRLIINHRLQVTDLVILQRAILCGSVFAI